MKFLKVTGNLIDIIGEDATLKPDEIGVHFSPLYQFLNGGNPISLGIITNEAKAAKYAVIDNVELFNSVEEFNNAIDECFIPTYSVYNEGLMNANLNQKVSNNTIDLDEMDPSWTPLQEAEWLYNNGVSGIRKKDEKPPYLT